MSETHLGDDPDPLSPALYRELFELSPTPAAVFDQNGACRLVNQALLHQLGYEQEPFISGQLTLQSLLEDESTSEDLIRELEDRRVLRRREVHWRDAEGRSIPMLLSGRAISLGGERCYEISLTDVSRLRSVERAFRRDHARLSSLISSLPSGLMLVNGQGIITEFNLALGDILAADPDEIKGLPYQRFLQRLLAQVVEPEVAQESLRHAVVACAEHPIVEVLLKGEKPRYLEVAFFPVWEAGDSPPGWGIQVRDVTQARDQSDWKLGLLSVLARDIRTPLATLKGHATALLANYQRWDEPMVLEFLQAMDTGTDELVRQVDRSLALTRVETGRLGLRPQSVAVGSLVEQAVERAAGSLSQMQVMVEVPTDLPRVRVDPARVEEVLVTLIENAGRYADAGHQMEVSAEAGSSMVTLAVTDRGPGIPPDQQTALFDRYTSEATKGAASGLGLFISRKIVEAHGGRLWLESPPAGLDHGCRFLFTLPRVPDLGARRARRSSPGRPLAGRSSDITVVLVEGDIQRQESIARALTGAGYRVETAPDGPAGLEAISRLDPEAVVLDRQLPGYDGLAICRNVRRWSLVPILMLTSRTGQSDLIAALDAGADDYLTPPFDRADLLARVSALLQRGPRDSAGRPNEDQATFDGLLLDYDRRQVWLDDRPIELTPTEFDLLAYLSHNRNRVLSHEQLLTHVWGGQAGSRHTLFVHINRLRKKIERDPAEPEFIVTRWGVGYTFFPN